MRIAVGEPAPLPENFCVAVYLPASNLAAYDVPTTVAVFRALPEVAFVVFGGYQVPEPLANVRCVGFVQDMPAFYGEVTALLRLVHHDGLSHSVVEALSFARYVIWTYPFAGTQAAGDAKAAVAAITELKRQFDAGALAPNLQGASAVTQRYAWYTLRDEFQEGTGTAAFVTLTLRQLFDFERPEARGLALLILLVAAIVSPDITMPSPLPAMSSNSSPSPLSSPRSSSTTAGTPKSAAARS